MGLDRLLFIFARKWIAGTTIKEAIRRAQGVNLKGERAIINYLGESYGNERDVRRCLHTYLSLLKQMKASHVMGDISVKPTQLGLLEGYPEFLRNYRKIASSARKAGIFVWIDMEEYRYVDDTIKAYLEVLKRNSNTGICIQARLRRSKGDALRVIRANGSIRIVKGAYSEREAPSYGPEGTRRNFMAILKLCIAGNSRVTVATHDSLIIENARRLKGKRGITIKFAMLNGIRGKLALSLANSREDVSIYLPFGEEWMSYALRRLREQGHALLILRSIFQG